MDEDQSVQNQNLVDDQMAQALDAIPDNPTNPAPGGAVMPSGDEPEAVDAAPVNPTPMPDPAPVPDSVTGANPDPQPVADPVVAPVDTPVAEPAADQPPPAGGEEPVIPVPEPTVPVEPAEAELSGEGAIPDEVVEAVIEEPAEVSAEEPAVDEPAEQSDLNVEDLDAGSGADDELMDVKQQALEQLTPLVSHLELPPEEKFETLMMIIRASDDKRLVKPTYEAAQAIEDEDKRAQALLDVVNEVNYLTQSEAQE